MPHLNSKWRSTFVVSFMTLLSRILGMVRDVVLVNVFGAGAAMDAFITAFKIPNFFRRLFAEGAFANAFVPVLSEYKNAKTEQELRALVSKTFGALALVLTILTFIVVLAAPWVMAVFAPGFKADADKFALASDLLRLTFPYLLCMSLVAFAAAILQSYQDFAAAAFAPVLLNICMIVAAWGFYHVFPQQPILVLGWAVLVAGVLQFAILLPGLYRKRLLVKPSVDFKHSGVREIFALMLPALFGVSVVQINLLLNSVWASFMPTGTVTWLYTAERLTELPLGLIGIAIASVILPSLSANHAEADTLKFRQTIDWASKIVVLVGLPASLAMLVLAGPMISVVFAHSSSFTSTDVSMSAIALQGMSLSIISFMLIKIFAPGFYARKDTRTPVKIGLIAVLVNIVSNIVLLALLKKYPVVPAHLALAVSSTLAALVNALLLYIALHRADIYRFGAHWRRLGLLVLVANTAMVLCLLALGPWFAPHFSSGGLGLKIGAFVALCACGAAVYFVSLLAMGFKLRELR